MFLNRLDHDSKVAFLKLAHYVANSNDDFLNSKKELIEAYCLEMNIENIDFKKDNFNIKEILDSVTDKKVQKIFLIEIMALIYSDEIITEAERRVIEAMEIFELNSTVFEVYKEWSKATLALYMQGQALIEL